MGEMYEDEMCRIEIKRNTPIIFTKKLPENENGYEALVDNVHQENNYYTFWGKRSLFHLILGDFGITSTVYDEYDESMLKGCKYEIRIFPYVLYDAHILTETDVADIRFDLYYDAWNGLGNIFSQQVDPNHPIGINITERLFPFFDDPKALLSNYESAKHEKLPEKGDLEDLTPYVQEVSLTKGDKISDYQIRLLYNDPYDQFWDLVSAFRFINQSLGNFFDFQVDES